MDTGLKIYSDAKKVAEKLSTLPENEKKIVLDKMPDVNIDDLTKELDDRINELRAKKEVKKETLKNIQK